MNRYALSARAKEDMAAHLNFLSERSSLAAERLALSLLHEFRHLADWPGSGRRRPDLTDANVLFWPMGAYWLIYREAGPGIVIARIVKTRQDVFSASLHVEDES